MTAKGLIHGPLRDTCLHLCVDMQRLFAPGGPWAVSWTPKVLPAIERLCARHATLSNIDPHLVDLMPSLAAFTPPAKLLNQPVYSPWTEGKLDAMLNGSGIDTLIITGGETDIWVLATVLGAVDRGFRVVLVTDAVYGSADETHDALMEVYHSRFSEQIEAVTMEETLAS